MVTNRFDLADEVRLLRDWGQTAKYHHVRHAYNFRMDNIQGAILDVKVRHLQDWTDKRRWVAAHYDELLTEAALSAPQKPVDLEHVYHVYAVRSPHRDKLQVQLKEAGVMTGLHYPKPVHVQPAYGSLGYKMGDFPASEQFAAETLSLPIYPEMTIQQIQYVGHTLHKLCASVTAVAGADDGKDFQARTKAVAS